MTKVTIVGLDLAKSVFQVHGADKEGRPVVRKKLRRDRCWRSSPACCRVSLDWRPVPQRIIGPGSYGRSGTRCD